MPEKEPLAVEPERCFSLEELGLQALDPANLEAGDPDKLESWLKRAVGLIDETEEEIRFLDEVRLPVLRLQIRSGQLDARSLWEHNRTRAHLLRKRAAARHLLARCCGTLRIRVEVGQRSSDPLLIKPIDAPNGE